MKLIILTQYFAPEMGAPQSRLLELAKGLKSRGWDVSVVTSFPNYPTGKIFSDYRGKFSMEDQVEGLKVKRFWLYASNSSKNIPRILSMLSFSFTSLFSFSFIRRQKADFLLVESPPLTLGFTGWLLSVFGKCKFIMNVSDIWPLSAKELGAISDGFLYRKLESLENFLYKKSDVCLGQSQEIVDHINHRFPEKGFLFRNGVDSRRFNIPAAVNKDKKEISIIYAGLLGIAQGILNICRNVNFAELGVEFHIYGNGAERKKIEEYLEMNPNRGIFLHNPVNRNEVPALLVSHSCTIIPLVKNIYGAVPSKIYEAMASGLPILFSGLGEGAMLIKKHECGLVSNPDDFIHLKKNIIDFRENSGNRVKMGENGKKAAKEVFDREIQIDRLVDYFSEFNSEIGMVEN